MRNIHFYSKAAELEGTIDNIEFDANTLCLIKVKCDIHKSKA